MILRSAQLRDPVLDALGVPVLRTGAVLRPRDDARAARRSHGWPTTRARTASRSSCGPDGSLFVPGESVTDPVALTTALAAAAQRAGARIECGTRVTGIRDDGDALVLTGADGEPLVRADGRRQLRGPVRRRGRARGR